MLLRRCAVSAALLALVAGGAPTFATTTAATTTATATTVTSTSATATTPDEPAPTDAPAGPDATAPAPTTPDDDGSGGDGPDLVAIAVIVVGVVALLAVLGALLRRPGRPAPAPPTATPRSPAPPSGDANLLSTAEWIVDRLSLELMGAEPTAATSRWSVERSRLDNVAIGARQRFVEGSDPNWQPLGESMSALAAALDTNLALRSRAQPDAQLIAESTQVVNRHRAYLQQLIAALGPTIRR